MIIYVRTTIVLDDALFRQAKRRAAEAGRTLSDIVSSALREALREAPPRNLGRFQMPTFGGPSAHRHEPADLARALEEEDRTRIGR